MNNLAVRESPGPRRKTDEPRVVIVGGPQCSLQMSLKLLIGRYQIRMRITEELDFSESPPAAEVVIGSLTQCGKPPERGAISRIAAVGDAARTQVRECVLDLSSEGPMW